jgi:hypothetical protein
VVIILGLKEKVEELKSLYGQQSEHSKHYLEAADKIREAHAAIKDMMDELGLDSFDSALGQIEVESKDTFAVAKADKPLMIKYFESDARLRNFVKVRKEVHCQTAQKEFREMYENENKVPDFVKVETYTDIKCKWNNFGEQKSYLDKIKKKQKKDTDSNESTNGDAE